MKIIVSVLLVVFTFEGFALEPANIREVVSKKKVIIEIDGKFPVGPATDVLFVVDDSGSMQAHQDNLKAHISSFAKQAKTTSNDFHIGVVGTSKLAFGKYKFGELVGVPSFITPEMGDIEDILGGKLILGTHGSGRERIFTPVMEALSDELLAGANKGFYRPDAKLAIILLTDTEDQSDVSAWDFVDYLVDLKGSLSQVTMQSFMVSSEEMKNNICESEKQLPLKIEEALRLLQGDAYSLCSTQMGQEVSTMSKKVFPPFQGKFIPAIRIDEVTLVGKPVINSIQVSFGNQKLMEKNDTGWIYDSLQNKIVFGQKIEWKPQGKDTLITVTYRPID